MIVLLLVLSLLIILVRMMVMIMMMLMHLYRVYRLLQECKAMKAIHTNNQRAGEYCIYMLRVYRGQNIFRAYMAISHTHFILIWSLIAGMCVKTRDDQKKKVFINVCTSDAIPAPEDISDRELITILESDAPSDFRVPMSIGQPHQEKDKCKMVTCCYWRRLQVVELDMNRSMIVL